MSTEIPPSTHSRRVLRRYHVVMRERGALEKAPFELTVTARSMAAARHKALCEFPDACILQIARDESS